VANGKHRWRDHADLAAQTSPIKTVDVAEDCAYDVFDGRRPHQTHRATSRGGCSRIGLRFAGEGMSELTESPITPVVIRSLEGVNAKSERRTRHLPAGDGYGEHPMVNPR
jgi:hypothetical protein